MTAAAKATFLFSTMITDCAVSACTSPRMHDVYRADLGTTSAKTVGRWMTFPNGFPLLQSLVFHNFRNDFFPLLPLGFVILAPLDHFVLPGSFVWLDTVFPPLRSIYTVTWPHLFVPPSVNHFCSADPCPNKCMLLPPTCNYLKPGSPRREYIPLRMQACI